MDDMNHHHQQLISAFYLSSLLQAALFNAIFEFLE